MIETNKILVAILTAMVIGIGAFMWTQVIDLGDRVLALEKDKEYLLPQVNKRIEKLEHYHDKTN